MANYLTKIDGPNRSIRVPEKGKAFLEAILEGEDQESAALKAGAALSSFYAWRKAEEAFAEAWDEAAQRGGKVRIEKLKKEARRRAVDGVDEGVYHLGRLMATEKRFSDNLLMFLLKQADPSFRENQQNINIQVNVAMADRLKAARERTQ
jgi:hypothetical protein